MSFYFSLAGAERFELSSDEFGIRNFSLNYTPI